MVVNSLNSLKSNEQSVKELMDVPVGKQEEFLSVQEHYVLTLERQREIIKEEMKVSMQKGEIKIPISVVLYQELRDELAEKGWEIQYSYAEEIYYLVYDISKVKSSLRESPTRTHGGGCEVE